MPGKIELSHLMTSSEGARRQIEGRNIKKFKIFTYEATSQQPRKCPILVDSIRFYKILKNIHI